MTDEEIVEQWIVEGGFRDRSSGPQYPDWLALVRLAYKMGRDSEQQDLIAASNDYAAGYVAGHSAAAALVESVAPHRSR
jgi:hypothetical protein